MAIVVNNPSDRTDSSSDIANLLVALAVIIVLVFGALYLLPRIANTVPAAQPTPGANINVTLPTGATGGGAAETAPATGGATQ